MRAYSALFRRKVFDWSFHPAVRWGVSAGLYIRYLLHGGGASPIGFEYLLRAHRYSAGKLGSRTYEKQIARGLPRWLQHDLPVRQYPLPEGKMRSFRARTLVLKPPRREGGTAVERGVLFTKTFWELAVLTDLERLLRDYWLVIEPGWSGYADAHLLYYCRFPHPVLVCSPEITDYQFLQNLHTNLIPVPIGASDWAHPEIFHPIEGVEKVYDAVMVAGWAVYKRHHALFRALKQLRRTDIKVAIVGFEWEGSREEIERLIDLYGVRKHLDIYQSLSPPEVNRVLNQSKVNLILTLREGANKSIFEGFFADVPGIVLRNNIGINKSYINQYTGRLIDEHELPQVILWFREHHRDFRPREWAMQNISPQATTAKLNAILRKIACEHGEPWTRDIVAKSNCPAPTYYPDNSVAAGFPTVDDILKQYGRGAEHR
ncbi:MAG: hypothetical protein KatS3mg022_3238 [Armatimonadota bacterium]|nr:MAG: hypothetical protein KatS3mg022_3238 [Armatimonadota bacterium]